MPTQYDRNPTASSERDEAIVLGGESLEALVAWIPAAVVIIDSAQTIRAANALAGELFGYAPQELVGHPLELLIPATARVFHHKATELYLARPYVRHRHSGLQFSGLHKSGEGIAVDISLSTMSYPDGIRAMAVITDAEDRVGRLAAETRAQHVVDFLSAVAHDIRNPLNSVLGFSQLLASGDVGPLNERQSRYVENIREAGEHILGLINDVLDLQAVESGRLQLLWEEVDVGSVVRAAAESIVPAVASTGVRLEIETHQRVTAVADGRRLRQIIENLLSNAVKYTQQGQISVTARCNGDEAIIEVADTGPGIPPDELALIFDPFVQGSMALRRTKSGSGLGLALTKRLVEALNGRFDLESHVGVGTTATVAIHAG